MFPESLLHYVWKFRLFDHNELKTEKGEVVEIIHPGHHNKDSGPDFSEAKIKIGKTIWAGQIEMHLKSSDWLKHRHDKDPAYENVVLHVVYQNDTEIFRNDGTVISTIELEGRISEVVIRKSLFLLNSPEYIPCASHFSKVPELIFLMWLERMVVERLEFKTSKLELLLKRNNNNWEETFYQFLGSNFGTPQNSQPFENLTVLTPLSVLYKHKNSLFQLEAILFGQSGLLDEDFRDDYPNELKKEYLFLKNKYGLTPILKSSWKFGRMRPASFPSLRIAFFAQLIHQSDHLFSKLLETEELECYQNNFELKISGYWLEHYRFDDDSKVRKQKCLGKSAFENIVINTLVPFLFLYGNKIQVTEYYERALDWLEKTSSEENNIIKMWKKMGVKTESAYQTQALLHLKKNYCDSKKCLECSVGCRILGK